MKKVILTILTVFWLSLIFFFSSAEADDSQDVSDSFIDNTIVNICKFFKSDLNYEEEKEIIKVTSYPVRKIAHFTEYLILGILVFLTFKEYQISYFAYMAFIFCVFYACSDEIHQYFVLGRSMSLFDCMIDSLGSLTSISFLGFKRR